MRVSATSKTCFKLWFVCKKKCVVSEMGDRSLGKKLAVQDDVLGYLDPI